MLIALLLILQAMPGMDMPMKSPPPAPKGTIDSAAGLGATNAYLTAAGVNGTTNTPQVVDKTTRAALNKQAFVLISKIRASYAAKDAKGYFAAIKQLNAITRRLSTGAILPEEAEQVRRTKKAR